MVDGGGAQSADLAGQLLPAASDHDQGHGDADGGDREEQQVALAAGFFFPVGVSLLNGRVDGFGGLYRIVLVGVGGHGSQGKATGQKKGSDHGAKECHIGLRYQ